MIQYTHVLFHKNCPDGFGAAWAAWKVLADRAKYIPVSYDAPVPELPADARVLMVDFCYPPQIIIPLARRVRNIVVFDHHVTSKDALSDLGGSLNRVRKVSLSNGNTAYVDADDIDKVSGFSWSEAKHGGAIAYAGGGRKNRKHVYMHQVIAGMPPPGLVIDHINRDPLDNRRANLRFASRQQNAANMDRGSKFKGIKRHKLKWAAQIVVSGKNKYLGLYASEEEAAQAYDKAAISAFGDYAKLNFPNESKRCLPPVNIDLNFDLNHSGAYLSWTHFHGLNVPEFVLYLEDRDLWTFKMPYSREVAAALGSYPMEFTLWEQLYTMGMEKLKLDGGTILRYQRQKVDEMCDRMFWKDFDGHKVPCANATVLFSEVGDRLCQKHPDVPFAAYFYERADRKIQWGLRSPGRFDVTAIAKKRGGGGHPGAAGFVETLPS